MRFKRRAFRDVEAYQFTQEMWNDKTSWPKEVVELDSSFPDEKENMKPAVDVGENGKKSMCFLGVNCWMVKCLETGQSMVYYEHQDDTGLGFHEDFMKVAD